MLSRNRCSTGIYSDEYSTSGNTFCKAASSTVRTARSMFCWLTLFAVSWCAGCAEGRETAVTTGEVTGTVTLKGKPLSEGRVNFISEQGIGSGGTLKPDGTYLMDGKVPVGHYKVFITIDMSPAKVGTATEALMKSIPEKYFSQSKSGLTADLEEGNSQHDFHLE